MFVVKLFSVCYNITNTQHIPAHVASLLIQQCLATYAANSKIKDLAPQYGNKFSYSHSKAGKAWYFMYYPCYCSM